jgi:hypothetical protein
MRAHPSGDAAFFAAIADMHRGRELLDKVDWGALSSEALIDTVRRMTVVEQQLHVVHNRLQREVVKRTLRTANPPYAETDRDAVQDCEQ